MFTVAVLRNFILLNSSLVKENGENVGKFKLKGQLK